MEGGRERGREGGREGVRNFLVVRSSMLSQKHCNTLQQNATYYITPQYTATLCKNLCQHGPHFPLTQKETPQYTVTKHRDRNTLPCTAIHCNTLQPHISFTHKESYQDTAPHSGNTQQHTVHNTRQHAITSSCWRWSKEELIGSSNYEEDKRNHGPALVHIWTDVPAFMNIGP